MLLKTNKVYTSLIEVEKSTKNELSRFNCFLEYFEIKGNKINPAINLLAEDIDFAERIFEDYNLVKENTICIAPYAQYGVRDYSGYAKILKKLPGYNFIILGSPDDFNRASEEFSSNHVGVINLTGKTSIRQMGAIIKSSKLLIGAESAAAHIACAVGVPNVVVIGGGHFGRFMPYSDLTSLVTLPLSCYGCNWQCQFKRAYCVKDVDHELIVTAVQNALEHKSILPRIYYNELPNNDGSEKLRKMFSSYIQSDKVTLVEVKKSGISSYSEKIISLSEEAIQLNNLNSANKLIENVLSFEISNVDALNNLAVIEIKEQNWDQASVIIDKLLALDPKNEIGLDNLEFLQNQILLSNALLEAENFIKLNELENAKIILDRILERDSDYIDALNDYAVIYIYEKKWKDALTKLKHVLRLNASNEVALDNLEILKTELNVNEDYKNNFLKISVITPSFNQGVFIEKTIQSVIDQKYPNFEHIIIDGGSTDETLVILKKYPHLIWLSEKDKGQSDALNKGMKMATGGCYCLDQFRRLLHASSF